MGESSVGHSVGGQNLLGSGMHLMQERVGSLRESGKRDGQTEFASEEIFGAASPEIFRDVLLRHGKATFRMSQNKLDGGNTADDRWRSLFQTRPVSLLKREQAATNRFAEA